MFVGVGVLVACPALSRSVQIRSLSFLHRIHPSMLYKYVCVCALYEGCVFVICAIIPHYWLLPKGPSGCTYTYGCTYIRWAVQINCTDPLFAFSYQCKIFIVIRYGAKSMVIIVTICYYCRSELRTVEVRRVSPVLPRIIVARSSFRLSIAKSCLHLLLFNSDNPVMIASCFFGDTCLLLSGQWNAFAQERPPFFAGNLFINAVL